MLGGLAMVVAIALFIMVHEAGHFLAAKATGMKATEFFLGFGPKIWSFQRGETEYGVKAIPFGGYVRILGMNPYEEIDPADVGRTYREKKFWQKTVVVLSGVALNFAMAYIILFGLAWYTGVREVTTTIDEVTTTITDTDITSPASLAGLRVGDQLVAIDGIEVEGWLQATELIAARPGRTVDLEIIRDGATRVLTAALGEVDRGDGEIVGFLGVRPRLITNSIGPLTAGRVAADEFVFLVQQSVISIGRLISPSSLAELSGALFGDTEVPDEIRPVSPIGLVQLGSQAERVGVGNLFFILASVNIILGLFNSIPLYPLDGGHFAVAVYERLTHREADVRRLAPIAAAVIALMVFLGLVAIVLDVANPIAL